MASLLQFLPYSYFMVGAMAVIGAFFIALLLVRPYIRKGEDRLHLLGLTEMFMLSLMVCECCCRTADDKTSTRADSSHTFKGHICYTCRA